MRRHFLFAFVTAVLIGRPTLTVGCLLQSDSVSLKEMIENNVTNVKWFMLYGDLMHKVYPYGKCVYKWNTKNDSLAFQRQMICYDKDVKVCRNMDANVIWQSIGCNELVETGVDSPLTARFYSQDPAQYLLYHSCRSDQDSGTCRLEFLDVLLRRETLKDGLYVDLRNVPLRMIEMDLWDNFKIEVSTKELLYHWNGPECDFDGSIYNRGTGWVVNTVTMLKFVCVLSLIQALSWAGLI